jgi:ATP/maltotriose-dependent transcriptional regulator MalT
MNTGNALCDLGILALYERRYEEAGRLFAESLESAIRTGYRINVVYTLRGIASVTAVRGEIEAAARMLGAAERTAQEIGEDTQGYARAAFAETTESVFERREVPAVAAAWSEGRAMSEADAAAYALAAVADGEPL